MINFIITSKQGYILGLLLLISGGIMAGCSAKAETKTPLPDTPKRAEVAELREPPAYRQNRNPYSDMPYDGEIEYSAPVRKNSAPLLTKTNFGRIKVGMSLTEAEKIMGDQGMLVSTMDVNGRKTQIYKWSNDDYTRSVDVTVENGKIIEKKDKGLK
jgi:hypothetical protein